MELTQKICKKSVSIALCTYNGEKFLRAQLDSISSQSYSNFELVISDDGSTDGTQEILKEFASKDTRIQWSANPNPNGFAKNFERAITLCKGEIIFLCDQDDVWYLNKIDKHIEAYLDKKVVWVYNKVVLIDKDGNKIGLLEDSAPDYYRNKTAIENTWGSCILGCATSYRAKDVHKIMPIGMHAPAHDSWIQMALYPKKAHFIDEYLQEYRIHDANTVGIGQEATKERETKAIFENMCYLKCLPHNRNLGIKKRLFFLVVFWAKKARAAYRHFVIR